MSFAIPAGEEAGGELDDSSAPSAIRTSRLSKRYRGRTVVDCLDLDVREGDRYGFLGPNGSGKTTTVRMLLGLVFPSGGRISVLGRPIPSRTARVLPGVGALVEGPAFYGGLSAKANLALLDAAGPRGARSSRRRRIGEALERVGLAGVGRKPVRTYSLGMRGRLGLAAAILRRPQLLILDEPTNGLDPHGIAEIRSLLIELNEGEGTTIFLSSHLLSEVEQLCTRVGVLNAGRLVLQEDMESLAGPTGRVLVRTPDIAALHATLGAAVRETDHNRVIVEGFDAQEVALRLVQAGVRLEELTPEVRTLESVVLAATGAGSDRVDRRGPVEPEPLPEGTPTGPPTQMPVQDAAEVAPEQPADDVPSPTPPVRVHLGPPVTPEPPDAEDAPAEEPESPPDPPSKET